MKDIGLYEENLAKALWIHLNEFDCFSYTAEAVKFYWIEFEIPIYEEDFKEEEDYWDELEEIYRKELNKYKEVIYCRNILFVKKIL